MLDFFDHVEMYLHILPYSMSLTALESSLTTEGAVRLLPSFSYALLVATRTILDAKTGPNS